MPQNRSAPPAATGRGAGNKTTRPCFDTRSQQQRQAKEKQHSRAELRAAYRLFAPSKTGGEM